MQLPSKELLSEVLGRKVISVEMLTKNLLEYYYENDYADENTSRDHINIYELAHKCKEWAKNQKYYLLSGIYMYNNETDGTYDCLINQNFSYEDDGCYISRGESCLEQFNCFNTEPEAIFEACQWILDNKGKS